MAGAAAIQLFGCREERPSPPVFIAVFVNRIDEVLCDKAAGHLQTCDIAVEAASHLRTVEAAGGA